MRRCAALPGDLGDGRRVGLSLDRSAVDLDALAQVREVRREEAPGRWPCAARSARPCGWWTTCRWCHDVDRWGAQLRVAQPSQQPLDPIKREPPPNQVARGKPRLGLLLRPAAADWGGSGTGTALSQPIRPPRAGAAHRRGRRRSSAPGAVVRRLIAGRHPRRSEVPGIRGLAAADRSQSGELLLQRGELVAFCLHHIRGRALDELGVASLP